MEEEEKPDIEFKIVPIDSLEHDPFNAREHGEMNVSAITASIRRFGQQKPIVVSEENVVLAGNATLGVMKNLGYKEIVIAVSKLSKEEAVAYAVADNRTSELSNWNELELTEVLSQLEPELLLSTGFLDIDLQDLIKDLEEDVANEEKEKEKTYFIEVACEDEKQQEELYNKCVLSFGNAEKKTRIKVKK